MEPWTAAKKASVAVPPAPVRVPGQRSLAPSVTSVTLNNSTNIHVITFNVHLAQFDVAPTRNLIISRCKIAIYVTSH
jgi:hypothetical protein